MDIAALLANIGPVSRFGDKVDAIRHGQHHSKQPDLPLLEFMGRMPNDVLGLSFGREAEDQYFTSLFAAIAIENIKFDPTFCAAANHLTLELTYQTRFALADHGAEAIVFDGDRDEFLISLANNNVIFGVLVSDCDAARFAMPAWAADTPLIDVQPELLVECRRHDLKAALEANGKSRIGLVVQTLPVNDETNFQKRFLGIADKVSRHTSYLFQGDSHRILELAAVLAVRHPSAHIYTRLYTRAADRTLGIVVAQGIEGLPSVDLPIPRRLDLQCQFVYARDEIKPSASKPTKDQSPRYQGIHPNRYLPKEIIPIKKPFAVFATAPLTAEIRHNITQPSWLAYDVVHIDNGYLVPVEDHSCHTYFNISERGEIVVDYGDQEATTRATSFWRNALEDAQGSRRIHLVNDKVVRVSGAAMPLFFTPSVHEWFSHFMIQCFPRLAILRELGLEGVKIIVPQGIRRKQRAMLHAMGYADRDIVTMPPGHVCQADELIVPRTWQLVISTFTAAIYQDLVANLGIETKEACRRVLISRESRKTWRNMLNFDAVKASLVEKHGFEVVKPETLSLRDEVDMYHHTKLLVGAEGAGLYGSLYAQPGAAVVSISDEDYAMPILGSIAAVRDFEVLYVFGESLQSRQDLARRLPFGHADFVVDPALVNMAVLTALDRLA